MSRMGWITVVLILGLWKTVAMSEFWVIGKEGNVHLLSDQAGVVCSAVTSISTDCANAELNKRESAHFGSADGVVFGVSSAHTFCEEGVRPPLLLPKRNNEHVSYYPVYYNGYAIDVNLIASCPPEGVAAINYSMVAKGRPGEDYVGAGFGYGSTILSLGVIRGERFASEHGTHFSNHPSNVTGDLLLEGFIFDGLSGGVVTTRRGVVGTVRVMWTPDGEGMRATPADHYLPFVRENKSLFKTAAECGCAIVDPLVTTVRKNV